MTKGSRPEQAVLTKVRPLTQLQHVKWKFIALDGGQINLPLIREDFFFSFVPHNNFLVSVSTLQGLFWADTMPFKGPQPCHEPWVQGDVQACPAINGGPRTLSKTTGTTIKCASAKDTHFWNRSVIVKSRQNGIELVTHPEPRTPTCPRRPRPGLSSKGWSMVSTITGIDK